MSWRTFNAVVLIGILTVLVLAAIPSGAEVNLRDAAPPQSAPVSDKSGSQMSRKHGVLEIMPEVSLYYPTDSKTTHRSGNAWGNITLALKLTRDEDARDRLDLRTGGISRSNGDGHVFMAPIGLTYTHHLSNTNGVSPYVGVGASALFVSLTSSLDNVRTGMHCLPSASVFAGVKLGGTGFVRAAYNIVPGLKGFNLSGVSASIGLGF